MKQSKKDYYGGALMALIGGAAVYASIPYRLGSLDHMGPGFFPCALGALLIVTGALIALSGRAQKKPGAIAVAGHAPEGAPDLRGCVAIVVAILAFLLLGHYFGLLPATFAITFISAIGDRDNTLVQSVVLSLAMTIVAAVVFWWALKLQLPLWKWEF
jgi:hypothetical protein